MGSYIARRILALLPVSLGVVTLTFAVIHLTPGDPVVAMLGENAAPADVEEMRHAMGLDQSLPHQYLTFITRLARGDLGKSITSGASVTNLIIERFPATLELAGAALAVAVLLAGSLGFVASLRPGSGLDLGAMGFAVLGVSVPHLCLGPLLMIAFSLRLGWLPLSGRGGLSHLVLPAVTLGAGMAAIVARILRQSLVETKARDYMRTARGKGLSDHAALLRHGVRNAATPVITMLGLEVGGLLTGSIVIEQIFSWPGLGRLMLQAIGSRDYPLVEGCVLVFSLSYVLVNLVTDMLYALVDPRVRLG
jgi:peptide/nickel transport system permease protein